MVTYQIKEWVREVSRDYQGEKVTPEIIEKIFWTAFRSYLNREAHRHKKDVLAIHLDDGLLARKGIPFVSIPTELWIEVPGDQYQD